MFRGDPAAVPYNLHPIKSVRFMARLEQVMTNYYDKYVQKLSDNLKDASMQRHRLQMENAWPGKYHAEVKVRNECEAKALAAGVVGGVGVHIGCTLLNFPRSGFIRGAITLFSATNAYFLSNALLSLDMVRKLTLVDHSLIADAFCPVLQQIEKDLAAGAMPKLVPEVAAYYAPLLLNCKRRAARSVATDYDDGVSGHEWPAQVRDGFERDDTVSRLEPEPHAEALNDPWAAK